MEAASKATARRYVDDEADNEIAANENSRIRVGAFNVATLRGAAVDSVPVTGKHKVEVE